MRRCGDIFDQADEEPFNPLANLFDVAFVFAVALLVALVSFLQVPDLLFQKDYTVITNPGTPEMKITIKDGKEIKHYEATDSTGTGTGELLGRAYRLADGRVVYVPKESEPFYAPPKEEKETAE